MCKIFLSLCPGSREDTGYILTRYVAAVWVTLLTTCLGWGSAADIRRREDRKLASSSFQLFSGPHIVHNLEPKEFVTLGDTFGTGASKAGFLNFKGQKIFPREGSLGEGATPEKGGPIKQLL